MTDTAESAQASPRTRKKPTPLAIVRDVMVTIGVTLLVLYPAWLLFVTDLTSAGSQNGAVEQFYDQHGAENDGYGTEHRDDIPTQITSGVFGVMHVPAWGSDYQVAIANGTSISTLNEVGIGHYTETAPPGGIGNAAFTAHRTTYGKPFRDVHLLESGDAIIVETADYYFVYRVFDHDIVDPYAHEVIDPVPPADGAVEGGRYLTLTTCHPIYSVAERYIVWAGFDYWTPKTEGLPPAMQEATN